MNFLETIRRHKKDEVALLEAIPMPEKSTRKFIDALSARTPSLIAEVKPMSPSKGKLMNPDDIATIVKIYSESADAISVLCDRKYFGGGFDLLAHIRSHTDLPILAKEFIIDAKQILHARDAGADAILLIATLLTPKQVEEFSALAETLGMAVLYEIHTKDEINSIPAQGADQMIIGINNRDLTTLEISMNATTTVAPMLRKKYPHHLIIAESGIDSIHTAQKLQPMVEGFLIGSGILESQNSREFLHAFSSLSLR